MNQFQLSSPSFHAVQNGGARKTRQQKRKISDSTKIFFLHSFAFVAVTFRSFRNVPLLIPSDCAYL